MLSTIRNKATSLISYILIGAICLSFALWGINSYFQGASEVDVAVVNGDNISYDFYQNQLRTRQQQFRQIFQNNLPDGYFDSPIFKRQTLDQIVNELLLNQIIQKRRYTLDDEMLAQKIISNQAFFTEGEFDNERYRRQLASNNWTVKSFEASQRQQGAYDQIRQALEQSHVITDEEMNDILKLKKQKRVAEYFMIDPDSFEPQITDEQIQQHYDDNQDLYVTPEQSKIDYVDLSVDLLAGFETVTDDEIEQYFQENKAGFASPEIRKASHILTKSENGNQSSTALKKSEEILEKIKSGENFEDLARQFSDDKGSSKNGGDLGVITRGVMVKPFEEAVFTLQQDEISAPVKSEFGYHIIKLTQLTQEQIPPLEEVKAQIFEKIKNEKALEEFIQQSELFKNLAFEAPDSLQPIADQLGLEIKQSDWFTRTSGTGIASDTKVREIAFTSVVLEDGLNGDVVESGENRLIALRKNDYQPSKPRPLEQVKEQISILLKSREVHDMMEQRSQELLGKLNSKNANWQKSIEIQGSVQNELPKTRGSAQSDAEKTISKVVFEQARPLSGQPVYGTVDLGDRYAVYRLSKVEDANDEALADITDDDRESLLNNLKSRFGGDNVSSILESIREGADIKIYQENF